MVITPTPCIMHHAKGCELAVPPPPISHGSLLTLSISHHPAHRELCGPFLTLTPTLTRTKHLSSHPSRTAWTLL